MAETSSPKQSDNPPSNNPFVFLTQIPQCLLNSFKNLTKKLEKKSENDNKSVKEVVVVEETSVINAQKAPDFVSFPWTKQQDVTPIKLESEDVQQDTNPIILWQVYALGGFIILKWAWGKWQEKKAKDKEDAPDDTPPNEDDQPAADD